MLVKGPRLCSVKEGEPLKDFRQDGDMITLAITRKADLGEGGKTGSSGSSPCSKTHLQGLPWWRSG